MLRIWLWLSESFSGIKITRVSCTHSERPPISQHEDRISFKVYNGHSAGYRYCTLITFWATRDVCQSAALFNAAQDLVQRCTHRAWRQVGADLARRQSSPKGQQFSFLSGSAGSGSADHLHSSASQHGNGKRTRGNGRGQAGLRCRRLRLSPQTGRNPPPVAHTQMSGRSCSRRGWPELTAQGRGPRGRWGGRRLLHRVPRSYR